MFYTTPSQIRQIVLQSAAIHPDWTVHDHISYLQDNEGYYLREIMRSPLDIIQRWLDEFSETGKLVHHLVRDHGWTQPIDPSDAETIIAQHRIAREAQRLSGCDEFPPR